MIQPDLALQFLHLAVVELLWFKHDPIPLGITACTYYTYLCVYCFASRCALLRGKAIRKVSM